MKKTNLGVLAMTTGILQQGLETKAIKMQPLWQVSFQAPVEDVDRIFENVTKVADLTHGKTDKNGFRYGSGHEYYRPREGTPTGVEDKIRKRPEVDQMSFFIPRNTALLDQVIEAIYAVHSYYEPVIIVGEILRSECKGLDDSKNPHRWWNKQGDWKKEQQ